MTNEVTPVTNAASPTPVDAVRPTPAPANDTEQGPDNTGPDIFLSLSRTDRLFLAWSAVAILGLLTAHVARLQFQRPADFAFERSAENRLAMRVEINSATWVEWMQLDGIGESLARAIVEDRKANGPFRSLDDVGRVRGIGDAKLAGMRPSLKCESCPPLSSGDSNLSTEAQ